MDKDDLQTDAVYAFSFSLDGFDLDDENSYFPVKVLDADHTYTRAARWLDGESEYFWQRDEHWTLRNEVVHPQDSHGVLVAGKPMLFWNSSWQIARNNEREAELQKVSLDGVLTGDYSGPAPASVVDPAFLVGEWDEVMAPVRAQRARDEARWELDRMEREREWDIRDRRLERERAELRRLLKTATGVKWCLILTAMAALVVPVSDETTNLRTPFGVRVLGDAVDGESFRQFMFGGQFVMPLGLLLAVGTLVLLGVKYRIRELEA